MKPGKAVIFFYAAAFVLVCLSAKLRLAWPALNRPNWLPFKPALTVEYLHLERADSITVELIQAAANLWVERQPQPHTHNATDYRYGRLRFISDAKQ